MPGVVCQLSLRLLHISNIGGDFMSTKLIWSPQQLKDSEQYKKLIRFIYYETNYSENDLIIKNKSYLVSAIRQFAHAMSYEILPNYTFLGNFWQRDHGTIMHSVKNITGLDGIKTNDIITNGLNDLVIKYRKLQTAVRFEETEAYNLRPNLPNQ
tara:strand:- start:106 stop:567 length:462 start_codon:yes stop_codon:yes gene_type:complete